MEAVAPLSYHDVAQDGGLKAGNLREDCVREVRLGGEILAASTMVTSLRIRVGHQCPAREPWRMGPRRLSLALL